MYNQKLPAPTPYAYPMYSQAATGMMSMPPMTPMAAPMTPMSMPGTVTPPPVPSGSTIQGVMPAFVAPGQTQQFEESYIENILRLNLGKVGTFYMTYENNSEWNAKIFKGVVEAAGRDHIIISDPKTGMRFLLLMVNLDYATFDEPLNYSYPVQPQPR